MRILLSGWFFPDSFARCIGTTAERMGHTVYAFDDRPVRWHPNEPWVPLWTVAGRAFPGLGKGRERRLGRVAREFHPDLVLFASSGPAPDTVREIRSETQAKIALWFPDHLGNLGRQHMLAADYDAWFFKDPYMARTFREKLALNAHYLPEACHSLWHRKVELTPEDRAKYGCDLTTASNMYYYRARTLEMFAGYDLKIWGSSWPRWLSSPLHKQYPGIYVAEERKSLAFHAAKIVLNTMHYAEIEGVNCRLFEAAGCGAFQIADWKPALPELFVPEREIVTFRTRRELKEKVDYYLAHPEERREIAERAYARAHRDHIYEVRLERIFAILGLLPQPAEGTAAAVEAR